LAADAMAITAGRLKHENLVDEVIEEPLGGAHRDPLLMAERLRAALAAAVDDLSDRPVDTLLDERARRFDSFGAFRAT
jgi:acetyl-CoA carboxylase carboxyl transferase subunit alpha